MTAHTRLGRWRVVLARARAIRQKAEKRRPQIAVDALGFLRRGQVQHQALPVDPQFCHRPAWPLGLMLPYLRTLALWNVWDRLPGMASADLLLHPVRLRIVKAFLGDRALTTSQLAAELATCPPGSLYRHVALLARAGVLQVVAERRVRGAVERTYTLRLFAAQIQPGEVAAMTPEEHAPGVHGLRRRAARRFRPLPRGRA